MYGILLKQPQYVVISEHNVMIISVKSKDTQKHQRSREKKPKIKHVRTDEMAQQAKAILTKSDDKSDVLFPGPTWLKKGTNSH